MTEQKGQRNMLFALGILLIAIALGAVGQLFLKSGVTSLGEGVSAAFVLKSIPTTPLILLGFLCYGLSSMFYLVCLSKLSLSYAYPMIALSYVIVAILSWKYLGEGLPATRIVGIIVIIIGVTLVAFSHEPEASAHDSPPAIELPADTGNGPN